MPAPLLPVLHRALIHAKVSGKFFLRHLDFLTNRPDIEMLRDVDAVLTRVGFSGGVRQGLACAGQDSAPGFRHSVCPSVFLARWSPLSPRFPPEIQVLVGIP